MAEFVQTMKDWRRMCKEYSRCGDCPLYKYDPLKCGRSVQHTEQLLDNLDYSIVEEVVNKWAEKHSEPVYETWFEYLLRIGVIPKNAPAGGEYHWIVESIKHKHISNDIAESLKLHPKEG